MTNAAGTSFAVFRFVLLKAALVGVMLLLIRRHRRIALTDLAVDFHFRLLIYGDEGVDAQRSYGGDLIDDISFFL